MTETKSQDNKGDGPDLKAAAKAFSQLGASKGGKARAEKLTSEERSEIARRAVETRWAKTKGDGPARQATHAGEIKIGEIIIPCAVLDDETRVLSETGLVNSLGLYRSGAVHVRARDAGDGAHLPLFIAHKNLKPFVDNELSSVLSQPIWYTPVGGTIRHKGVNAELIPRICEVWLRARDAGVLGARQKLAATKADILMRGLAHVGIKALVDEATGYQYDRARKALSEILEKFISKELVKYSSLFADDFYREMFRLRGWKYNEGSTKRPIHSAKLTIDLVYVRLAPGVLEELKRLTPRDEKGRLKHKLFQRLTEEFGHPRLREHLKAVTHLMMAFDDWRDFYRGLQRSFPKYNENLLLNLKYSPDSGKET
jgi:hypothetical protein